ncbi:O-acetylhomoserine aminocarboxypropyltransferase/cysteine synthase family protein [Ruminiclostridium josui]|uniref:O-acetylhomoserine aminocarboxypropyltransferase/cysteine synthase family protein n=1 Tax=Ruminiclostridium josui TaxID=1499 RepID=UPI0004671454|nr:aminotransferase class I/II-fold pyridoxal phosphate-dependent enzyme [Ruminiclostridium josui]
MKFNTSLLHGGYSRDNNTGAILPPIYQTSAFGHKTAEQLENTFNNHEPGFSYSRINNPTIESFEKRIAYLEGGIGAVACSSGMAAISLAILNILRSGDEIVSSASIFGGTIGLFKDLQAFGITTNYVLDQSPESYEAVINKKTKLIFTETIGNPKLDVVDISAIARLAHSHKIPLIVDNTAATPFLVKPISFGADVVVHSASKYINGSGNSISGVIIDSGRFDWDTEEYPSLLETKRFGQFIYLSKLRGYLFRNFGSCLSPFNAYLNSIGLETLGIRMERLCNNALKLAEYIQSNYKNITVNYPGLKSSEEEKKNAGIYDDLIRVSVGLEDIEDLINDFDAALEKMPYQGGIQCKKSMC